MKRILQVLFATLLLAFSIQANAQKNKIYNPNLNGKKQLLEATTKARIENKQVFVMVGGNWCRWCIMFDKYIKKTPDLKQIMDDNYVWVHLNYSKENKNFDALELLDFPQRFGFPVFVILDKNGNRIHTQNSAYLEEGEGYGHDKVKDFLMQWTVKATDKAQYLKDKK